jgi:type VI secretion system secreted protein Hcp
MAVNAYLVIDGLPGPSTSRKDAIDILSFSFGASNTVSISSASGAESKSGRANLSDVSIMKVLDKTSPLLFQHCVTGTPFKKATLFYDKPMGDKADSKPEDYFKIEMTNVLISSIQLSGSNENPVESLSMAFETVKVGYNPEKPGGKSLAGFIEKGYDLKTLKAS